MAGRATQQMSKAMLKAILFLDIRMDIYCICPTFLEVSHSVLLGQLGSDQSLETASEYLLNLEPVPFVGPRDCSHLPSVCLWRVV